MYAEVGSVQGCEAQAAGGQHRPEHPSSLRRALTEINPVQGVTAAQGRCRAQKNLLEKLRA